MKIPKKLGAVADLLYELREHRYALKRDVKEIERKEAILRTHLIDNLPKSEATGVSGEEAHAQVVVRPVPKVEDWEAVHKYVKAKGAWDLLQRRLANEAVKERWDNGVSIPGVTTENVISISLTKVKK